MKSMKTLKYRTIPKQLKCTISIVEISVLGNTKFLLIYFRGKISV